MQQALLRRPAVQPRLHRGAGQTHRCNIDPSMRRRTRPRDAARPGANPLPDPRQALDLIGKAGEIRDAMAAAGVEEDEVSRTLLTTYCLLLTTYGSLLTTHYSLLTAHYSPLTTHHSPLTTHHSPLTAHY